MKTAQVSPSRTSRLPGLCDLTSQWLETFTQVSWMRNPSFFFPFFLKKNIICFILHFKSVFILFPLWRFLSTYSETVSKSFPKAGRFLTLCRKESEGRGRSGHRMQAWGPLQCPDPALRWLPRDPKHPGTPCGELNPPCCPPSPEQGASPPSIPPRSSATFWELFSSWEWPRGFSLGLRGPVRVLLTTTQNPLNRAGSRSGQRQTH